MCTVQEAPCSFIGNFLEQTYMGGGSFAYYTPEPFYFKHCPACLVSCLAVACNLYLGATLGKNAAFVCTL